MSGGRLVHSEMKLANEIYHQTLTSRHSPHLRVLTFYLGNETEGSEVIADSAYIDVHNRCGTEVFVQFVYMLSEQK